MDQTTNKERILADMKVVLSDAEDMLKQAAGTTGEKAAELRERAAQSIRRAKEKLQDAQVVVIDRTKEMARATDDYVHDNPWQAVGIAAALGFVIGLMINRK